MAPTELPQGVPVSLRRIVVGLWLAAAVLVALTWRHVFVLVAEGKQAEWASANRDLANLARVSEEHASRTLRSADQVVQFVNDRYLDLGARINLTAMTERGVIDASLFNQVGIIDARGFYAHANRPIPVPIDLSDREHFRVHVESDTGQLFVSRPVLGRSTNRWSIQLTRRIRLPTDRFGGVVVISIDPTYFTRFYGDLSLGPKGMAALYGLDGVARARIVGDFQDFGANASDSQMFTLIAQGQQSGGFTSVSVVDGVKRLYHYRKLPNHPLVVVIGRDVVDVLAQHQRSRNGFLMQASVMTGLIFALAVTLTWYLLRMRREWVKRAAAQWQLSDRTEQLNAVFELSPDGFVTFDNQNRVKYVSPAFCQLTACTGDALERLDEQAFCAWLIAQGDGTASLPRLVSLGDQADAERMVIALSKPARRVLQLAARKAQTAQVAKILYVRDITHESEVAQIKSEFLSTAAHELRTPMASVLGFSEVLLSQPDLPEPERQEFVEIIHKQSQNIAVILDELLDLARIEARRGKDFKLEQVDVGSLLQEVVKTFKPPKDRTPPVWAAPTQSGLIRVDRGKVRQALLNVLSNAYKYSPNGGDVALDVSVHGVGEARQICISVNDTGIGMTPEQVQRVCERFYRADTSGTLPGSGLGMSIVSEIMALHNGRVVVESHWGSGTRVSLCFPQDGGVEQQGLV